jgi:hypothetical protein
MNVLERTSRKSPIFFRKLRTVALLFTGVSTAVLTAPVALPAVVLSVAGYLATAGAVAAAVCQVTVEGEV